MYNYTCVYSKSFKHKEIVNFKLLHAQVTFLTRIMFPNLIPLSKAFSNLLGWVSSCSAGYLDPTNCFRLKNLTPLFFLHSGKHKIRVRI